MYIKNWGIMVIWVGMIKVARIRPNNRFFPLNLYLAMP